MKMNIPFSPPDITTEEADEVREALLSGWITTGPRTSELERQIAEFCHTRKAICLNSATASMELALWLMGIGAGDEVIVPAYTYTATASVVCHVGAKVVFVDCAKDSYEMDYDKLEAAINERTKAIITVDLAGIICNYERIFEAVERQKHLFHPATEAQQHIGRVVVIADSAHGFGSMQKGRMSGEIADITCFSFHAVKNFTTGEGGAMTVNFPDDRYNTDEYLNELYRKGRLYALHGQSKDALSKTQLGNWEYDIVAPFYKCNMTDITAAIGLVQMRRYSKMLQRRRQLIEYYNSRLAGLPVSVLEHYTEESASNGHLYLVRLHGYTELQRNELIIKMAERGVATNVHFKPLPMMTAYKNLGADIKDYPNAYAQYANTITLPLYSRLTDEQAQYVMDSFVECINESKK